MEVERKHENLSTQCVRTGEQLNQFGDIGAIYVKGRKWLVSQRLFINMHEWSAQRLLDQQHQHDLGLFSYASSQTSFTPIKQF